MNRLNPTVVFLMTMVLVLAALFVPGVAGGVLLLILVALAATLLTRTWPHLPPAGRAIRLAVLGVLTVLAVARFM